MSVVVAAAALALLGFSRAGWTTAGQAERMASTWARGEIVAALVPICLEQSKQDPWLEMTVKQLKAASSYELNEMLMKAGWATLPGSCDPIRQVADACMEKRATQFCLGRTGCAVACAAE